METEILEAPSDGISALEFSRYKSNFLLATSWDKKARIYDVNSNTLLESFSEGAPILDGKFVSENRIVTGGLDKTVNLWTFGKGDSSAQVLARHESAVKSISFNSDKNLVIAGGWDARISISDPRESTGSPKQYLDLNGGPPEKVYSLDSSGYKLVVATSGRLIYQYDLRNISTASSGGDRPFCVREASLRHQLRCIRLESGGGGECFVTSSIEGRVAVDYWEPSEEAKKYAFKAHRSSPAANNNRTSAGNVELVYPINAIAFHPLYSGCFVTAGSDGHIFSWDRVNKKRIRQLTNPLRPYPTTISAIAWNVTGNLLAVASSYTYEEGVKDHPPDSIYIRNVQDIEIRPKQQHI